jgi:hypothetical protein
MNATQFRSCGNSENLRTQFNALLADVRLSLNGTFVVDDDGANLAIGGTVQNVYTGAFKYQIRGPRYVKNAVAAGTAFTATTDDVSDGSCRAFLLSIGTTGTITITPGTEAVGTEPGALPTCPVNDCPIGLVTIAADGAIFNATTDSLAASHLTVTYTNYNYANNYEGYDGFVCQGLTAT